MKTLFALFLTISILSTTAFASEKHDWCLAVCGGATYQCNSACGSIW